MQSGWVRHSLLPHTPKLFSDLLYDFASVERFYARPEPAIAYPEERRAGIVEALRVQNPGHPLLEQLAQPGTAVVVTGQQVGLFGGPAYTIYKALTAVKTARETGAVPVFWLATEDHDLAEIDHVWVFDAQQNPVRLRANGGPVGVPVGGVELAAPPVDELRAALEGFPFGGDVTERVAAAYRPGRTMGAAFTELLRNLLGQFGVLTLDPLRPEIRQLAAPMLAQAAGRAAELVGGILERNRELATAGYHAQVHAEPNSSLLFLLDRGRRRPLRYREGRFFAGEEAFTAEELAARAADLSPNALLRPVIQDYLLPTAAFIGGPAELAYMAQSETIYRKLLGRMPAIAPRAFFTLLDARAAKLTARYELELADCFAGFDALRERIAGRLTPPELTAEFRKAATAASRAVDQLRGPLARFDPTLASALARGRARILHQIARVEKKAAREALRRDERAERETTYVYNLLYPRKQLQERFYGILPFAARHGLDLIGRLYENIRLDSTDHQVLAV
ncbi:MAG: bacillithiol biosynthesis cysteine-adding enzyme BshC [Acidobacteria bacterium]|nr:bacillithiol biosynthesis cysteine-adding enzyme BshC [Acidobacteriota bacterium]